MAFDPAVHLINNGHTTGIAFADDCAVLIGGNNPQELHTQMQKTLDELVHWGTTCGLRFNPHKTNAVFFTRSRTLPHAPLLVDGMAVLYSLRAKYLGIELDRRLWWDDHVQRKIAQGKKLLNALLSATRGNWGPMDLHCHDPPIYLLRCQCLGT